MLPGKPLRHRRRSRIEENDALHPARLENAAETFRAEPRRIELEHPELKTELAGPAFRRSDHALLHRSRARLFDRGHVHDGKIAVEALSAPGTDVRHDGSDQLIPRIALPYGRRL